MINPILSINDLFSNATGNTAHYTASNGPTPQQAHIDAIRNAIGAVETGGVKSNPYQFSQSSGNKAYGQALGKYQVTEALLKQLAPLYLRQSVTPQQFLSNPTMQDNFMNARMSHFLAANYTPQQIADMHNAGTTNAPAPGSSVYQNPKYVAKFNKVFMGQPPRTVAGLNQ